MGLLLLFLFSELARREAIEGILWPTVRRFPFQPEVAAALFVNGQPSQTLKDALEAAASESQGFRLRHVFGIEGLQNWFDTVYLQFGFTHRGSCGGPHPRCRGLADWLSGSSQPLAIQELNETSPSFSVLWQRLRSFRHRIITGCQLRESIESCPWVLPQWTNDLVRETLRKVELPERNDQDEDTELTFLSQPKLRWNPPSAPMFATSVVCLADLELDEPSYNVLVGERSVASVNPQEILPD